MYHVEKIWNFVFLRFSCILRLRFFSCSTCAIGHGHSIQIMENAARIMENSWKNHRISFWKMAGNPEKAWHESCFFKSKGSFMYPVLDWVQVTVLCEIYSGKIIFTKQLSLPIGIELHSTESLLMWFFVQFPNVNCCHKNAFYEYTILLINLLSQS